MVCGRSATQPPDDPLAVEALLATSHAALSSSTHRNRRSQSNCSFRVRLKRSTHPLPCS